MQKQSVKTANRKMGQTSTHNANQQSTEQQRASPLRNQEENNQATIIVTDTQEDTQQGSTFFIPRPQSNQLDRVKVTPKIINLLCKP